MKDTKSVHSIQEIQGQLHQIQPEKDSLSKFLFEVSCIHKGGL